MKNWEFLIVILDFIARLVTGIDQKEVASDPPQIKTGPGKKGGTDAQLFSRATYNSIGNPFKEAAKSLVRREDRAY